MESLTSTPMSGRMESYPRSWDRLVQVSAQAHPKGGGGGVRGVRLHPPFGSFVFFFLLVREVGNVRWVPLLCVRKIDPNNLRSKKRKWRSPPPPPPRSSAFSGVAWLSRLAADRVQNCTPPFQKASYGPAVHHRTFSWVMFEKNKTEQLMSI